MAMSKKDIIRKRSDFYNSLRQVQLSLVGHNKAWWSLLRKWRSNGVIVDVCLRRPIRDSSCFLFTRGWDNIVEMSFVHFWCLSCGSFITRDLVFTSHPRMIFDSSICPSAKNFSSRWCLFEELGWDLWMVFLKCVSLEEWHSCPVRHSHLYPVLLQSFHLCICRVFPCHLLVFPQIGF